MEPFIGQVMIWSGNFQPRGWAYCDGRILSISSNTALFSLLGTEYGGDGRTTFALPDFRGRVHVGSGQGPGLSGYRVAQQGGREKVTLTTQQLTSHTHTLHGSVAGVVTGTVSGKVTATLTPEIPLGSGVSTQAGPGLLADGSAKTGAGRDAVSIPFYTTETGSSVMAGTPIDVDQDVNLTPALSVAVSQDLAVADNGGGQAFDIRQPYLAMNYIIALEGLYPERS